MSADVDAARELLAQARRGNTWNDVPPTTDQAIALAGVHAQLALVEVFERIEAAEAAAAAEHAERMAAIAREKEETARQFRPAPQVQAWDEPLATQLDQARAHLITLTEALGVEYDRPGWLTEALDAIHGRTVTP